MNKKLALVLYLVLFLMVFLQFPIAGSLPGKVDTWFFVVAFNTIGSHIHSFFKGTPMGTAVYPSAETFYWGNYSFGQAIFFLPFKYMGCSDIVSYYFLVATIFALNAWTVFLVNTKLGLRFWFAFIGGIFFSCCNFAFGNLDNPDALFFGACFLSVFFFLNYLEKYKWKEIILAALLASIGIYFSSYNFLFNFLLLCICLFFSLRNFFFQWYRLFQLLVASVIAFIILLPYLYIYVFSGHLLNAYNPALDLKALQFVSFHISDLFRVIPGNMIYNISRDMDVNWLYKTRSLCTGITLFCLTLIGIAVCKRHKAFFFVTFAVFGVMSLGPYLVLKENYYPAPMYLIYKYGHINNYFRINIRAYFLCVFVMSFFAACALQYLHQRNKRYTWIIWVACLTFCVENIPARFLKYSSASLINNAGCVAYPSSKELRTILHLPSSIVAVGYPEFKKECEVGAVDAYEFGITREHIYMCLQAQDHQNTVNGVTGFLSKERIANQILIQDITVGENLKKLIQHNRLTDIVFHKKYNNGCDYSATILFLKKSDLLFLRKETEKTIEFEVVAKP